MSEPIPTPPPEHPPPGVPVATEPEDLPDRPLTAADVPALIPKIIG